MFYQSVVASVLFYTVVCWGGSISKKDTSRLGKLIRWAGSVVGAKLDSLVTVAEMRTLDKLLHIIDNTSHPLNSVISNQRSLFSDKLLLPKCRTNRLKNSFVHHHHTLQLLTGGRMMWGTEVRSEGVIATHYAIITTTNRLGHFASPLFLCACAIV